MIGNIEKLYMSQKMIDKYTIYQPIPFWFCGRKTLALPILNIIYNKIYIDLEINDIKKLIKTKKYTKIIYNDIYDKPNFRLSLLCNFIYLEQPERIKMASTRHEYLIEQIQSLTPYKTVIGNNDVKLGLKNSVKEIYWYLEKNSNKVEGKMKDIVIKLDGIDRFKKTDESFFRLITFYENKYNIILNGLNMYSFGINTRSIMPSGTCNFSVIKNARLLFKTDDRYDLKIYGKSYNILRIMSGYAGLAFY
jgi:hypothetical protein